MEMINKKCLCRYSEPEEYPMVNTPKKRGRSNDTNLEKAFEDVQSHMQENVSEIFYDIWTNEDHGK